MKHCINTKSREFISLHEEYNRFIEPIGEMTLSGKVGTWLDINKVNRIPSLEELLSPLNNTEIKEGVVELFESNPELANTIYETLGFEIPTSKLEGKKAIDGKLVNFDVIEELASAERSDVPSSILIKKLLEGGYLPKINETDIVLGGLEYGEWKPNLKKIEAQGRNKSTLAKKIGHELLHSVTHNIIYSYQNLKGVIDFNDKYNKDNIKQGYIKPVNLTKFQIEALDNLVRLRNKVVAYVEQNKNKIQKQDRGFGTYDYFIRENYTKSETDLHEFISEVFTNPELINILKEIPTEGKKSNLFKDFVEAIAKILGFTNTSILEDVIAYSEEAFFTQPQITPQQKLQAQQIYSQYLDTIFPDSKQDILGFKQYIKDTKIDTINLEIVRLKKAINELHHEIVKTIPDSLRIARFAEFYGISELGYFNNKPDPDLLLQDIKKLNIRGLGIAIAKSGNPYLTRDGKIYKPHKNIQRGVSANSLIKQYMKEQYVKSVQMQNLYEKLEYEEFKKQLEKDCIITAKDGLSTSFTPNGKWEIVKDLTGLPKHSQGGVDLMISNGRVNFMRS